MGKEGRLYLTLHCHHQNDSCIKMRSDESHVVGRFGLAVRRKAGKQNDLGSNLLRLSFLFKKVVVCGHCLVTLSLTINETLKWPSSLPI